MTGLPEHVRKNRDKWDKQAASYVAAGERGWRSNNPAWGIFQVAESELQLGLPSISRYIKDLETRLGVRLCRRGRVGFSLTDQGRRIVVLYRGDVVEKGATEDVYANPAHAYTQRLLLAAGMRDAASTDLSSTGAP